MIDASLDWSVIALIVIGLIGLTLFGIWHRRRQGAVKLASGEPRVITPLQLPGPLADGATLVMFSTRFCAICPSARALFESVVSEPRARFYEIDAEQDLDLAKRFGVKSTPTTLVLNSKGEEVARIIGAPKRSNTLAIIDEVAGVGVVATKKRQDL